MPARRPAPSWVIVEEYEDEPLGALSAGKEAGCFLFRRSSGDRFCLLVRKDYRKRSDRVYSAPVSALERGLRRDTYTPAMVIVDRRERRAAAKGNALGKRVIESHWIANEFEMLGRAWAAGVRVPYPVATEPTGLVMQFIGSQHRAAPRIADMRLTPSEAAELWPLVLDGLRGLAATGIVHGDLSAYNILVQHGRPWFIDFPQAGDLYLHPSGGELLERDTRNIATAFRRLGVDLEVEDVARSVYEEFFGSYAPGRRRL